MHQRRTFGRTSTRLQLVVMMLLSLPVTLGSHFATGTEETLKELRQLEAALIQTIAQTLPAVVFIDRGSGVIVSEDGLLLTNDHVVTTRTEIVVRLALSGRKRIARLLGRFPKGDLALFQIDGKGPYPFLPFGDSDKLVPGQRVVALGNPFLLGEENGFFAEAPADFHPTATLGVVSALHRNAPPRYPDAIQVDAPVNPGNSGGPLVSLDGALVGINGKIETRFGLSVNSGVGYAVPSNQIVRFFEPLKRAGGKTISSGQLLGLEVMARVNGDQPGLPVRLVVPDSQAFKAGLRKGDRILSVDEYTVTTRRRFLGILKTYPVGSQVAIRFLRESEKHKVVATLDVAHDKPVQLGIKVTGATDSEGVLLVEEVLPNSPAENAGIKKDDIILTFDGAPVRSIVDPITGMSTKMHGDVVVIKVRRMDLELSITVLLKSFDG